MRTRRAGRRIAALLAGAWRRSEYPDLTLAPGELEALAPHLQRSGAAALAWWRIRHTEHATAPAAAALHDDYVFQALRCSAFESRIEYVFRLLKDASIDAILLKGWASAADYAHVALRPYGDIDLLVRPEDLERTQALLAQAVPSEIDCDLHDRVTDLPDRTFDELHQRSRALAINDTPIRVLGYEDHLAHLCLHFIRHHAWRPVWLCDVAATLEALPVDFDWRVCVGLKRTDAKWIACVIDLARDLLKAEPRSLPQAHPVVRAPRWLVSWTLSYWTHPGANVRPALTPMSRVLSRPRGLWHDLRGRWPKPVTAANHFGNSPEVFPLPYQLAMFVATGARFCGRFATGRARP